MGSEKTKTRQKKSNTTHKHTRLFQEMQGNEVKIHAAASIFAYYSLWCCSPSPTCSNSSNTKKKRKMKKKAEHPLLVAATRSKTLKLFARPREEGSAPTSWLFQPKICQEKKPRCRATSAVACTISFQFALREDTRTIGFGRRENYWKRNYTIFEEWKSKKNFRKISVECLESKYSTSFQILKKM